MPRATPADLLAAINLEHEARQRSDGLVVELRDAGYSWPDLVRETGLTMDALKWRAARAEAPEEPRTPPEEAVAALKRERPGQTPPRREPFEHEISVTAAAEALGITRPSVHTRARTGKLEARTDERGHLRIAADALGRPLTP